MTTPTVIDEALGEPLAVRAKIMTLGWKNLNVWARAFGHKPGIVHSSLKTWGNRADRKPHGGLSRAVMADLRATVTQGIRPSDRQQTA